MMFFLPPNVRPFAFTPEFKPEWRDQLFDINDSMFKEGKLLSMTTETSAHVFIVTKVYSSEQDHIEFMTQRVPPLTDYLKAAKAYNEANNIIVTVEQS